MIEVSPGFAPRTFTVAGRGSAGNEPYRQAKMPTYASARSTMSRTLVSGGAEPATMSSMANTS